MRKATKKQLENFINILPSVNEYILKNIAVNMQQTLNFIADSYDGIQLMYQTALESEKEDSALIQVIERYKQQLELIYTVLEEHKTEAAKEAVKQLYLRWDEMSSIISQINPKLEVVFMPYKASMWDSLESVWMEADADTDCEAYVVPIPYYDKKPDGTFGELHYEGNQFPS